MSQDTYCPEALRLLKIAKNTNSRNPQNFLKVWNEFSAHTWDCNACILELPESMRE